MWYTVANAVGFINTIMDKDMKQYRANFKSRLFAKCLKWLVFILIVIVGAHNFELVKQYYLFIILAALILLLAR